MQEINTALDRLAASGMNKRSETTSQGSTSKKTLALVWATLLNRRLVSEPVGSLQHKQFESDMADLGERELMAGLEKCKAFTGYFTFPAFRELCKVTPADLGLSEPRAAMIEACNAPYPKDRHAWSHVAVYLTACEVGWWPMQNLTERELMPIWAAAYEVMCRRVMAGESLSMPIPKALPEKVHVPLTPEKSKERLSALKGMLT